MERDYKKELANFERVWQRVTQSRGSLPAGLKLKPGKSVKILHLQHPSSLRIGSVREYYHRILAVKLEICSSVAVVFGICIHIVPHFFSVTVLFSLIARFQHLWHMAT